LLEVGLKWVLALSAVASLAFTGSLIVSQTRIFNRLKKLDMTTGNVVAFILQLNGLKIAVAGLVFLTSIVSFGMLLYADSHSGDVPAQLWGLSAGFAAGTAVVIAGYLHRWRNRKKVEKRALWRAKRVAVRVDYGTEDGSKMPIEILLTNRGPAELYEVEWFDPLIVYSGRRKSVSVMRAIGATVTGGRRPLAGFQQETFLPRQSQRSYLRCDSHDSNGRSLQEVMPSVTYLDVDGNRIGRVLGKRGRLASQSDWAIVDDRYPATASGGWPIC
jgi:hypothetical protein